MGLDDGVAGATDDGGEDGVDIGTLGKKEKRECFHLLKGQFFKKTTKNVKVCQSFVCHASWGKMHGAGGWRSSCASNGTYKVMFFVKTGSTKCDFRLKEILRGARQQPSDLDGV